MNHIEIGADKYLGHDSFVREPSLATDLTFSSRRGFVTLQEGDQTRHKVVSSAIHNPTIEQLKVFPKYLRSPDELFFVGNPEQAVYASEDKHMCLDDRVLWKINNEPLSQQGDQIIGQSVLVQEFGYDLRKLKLESIGPTDFSLMPYMLEQERVRFAKEGQITKLMHGVKVLHASSMPLSCPTMTPEGPVCLEDWGKHPKYTDCSQFRIVGALKGEVCMQEGPTDIPYTIYDDQHFIQLSPEGFPVRGF